MVVTGLAGCGKTEDTKPQDGGTDQTTESEPAETETEGATEKKQVVLWHSNVSPEVEPFEKMLAEFNAQSDTVEVVTEWVPREEQTKQLTIGNMAGELPDMVYVDNPEVINYGEMGVFQDISGLYDEWEDNQLLDLIQNSCVYDGKMYGVPYICNNLALFYNKDMLAEAGVEPPTTWDELVEAAKATTKDNVYGLAYSAIKKCRVHFPVHAVPMVGRRRLDRDGFGKQYPRTGLLRKFCERRIHQ